MYRSGASRQRWFILLLGTVLATLVLARVLNLGRADPTKAPFPWVAFEGTSSNYTITKSDYF